MDDFITFLVIGLVIIAAAMAVFMVKPEYNGNQSYVPQDTIGLHGAAIVGAKDITTFKPYDVGYFIADFVNDEGVYTLGNKIIQNGILFGNTKTDYHVNGDFEDISISFTVRDTNNYAPLEIKINGQTAAKDVYKKGSYTVSLASGSLPDDIVIELSAESSGIRMWAPTYYELEDIRIMSKGFSQNSDRYDFYLTEEFNKFQEGRLELNMDENMGDIVISMNDLLLYSGPVKNVQSIKFNKDILQYGNNILTISAKQDSRLTGHARMLVYYTTKHTTRMEVPFNINTSEYTQMKNGQISFSITSIVSNGGLTVKIVNANDVLYNNYATVNAQSYSFDFAKSEIRQGTNYLVIEAVDNAVFAIANIAVKI